MNRRFVSILAVLAVVPAAPAAAQVHVDPGSPSGKEYAIPLESARQNAAGNSGTVLPGAGTSSAASGTSAPLFGEGVGDKPKGARGRSQRGTRSGIGAGGGSSVDNAIAGAQPVRATIPSGGPKSTLTIAALALSVLLLGGVLGSIARRRNS